MSPPPSLSTSEEASARDTLGFQDQSILAAIIQRPDGGQGAGSEAGSPATGTDTEADDMGCFSAYTSGDEVTFDNAYMNLYEGSSPRDGDMQQVAAGSVQPAPQQIRRWSMDYLLEAVTGVLGRNCVLSTFRLLNPCASP